MTRKHDPPPGRDRLPAMFVGDEEPLPQPLLPEMARETAAMLPQDLQVTVEGSTAKRLPLVLAGLLAVLLGAVGIVTASDPYAFPLDILGGYAVTVALCAGLGWLTYRHLFRHRRQYRLTDGGIVLQVWRGTDPRPWITEIAWTEIAHYTASVDTGTLYLRVESVRGYTLSLQDRPPRLSTREFIRRFIEQAERHPRAVRAETGLEDSAPGLSPIALAGCAILTVAGVVLGGAADLSSRQTFSTVLWLVTLIYGLRIWSMLDDADVAHRDQSSRRRMARLRRGLRRVLGMH
jgi:hypothetical protein